MSTTNTILLVRVPTDGHVDGRALRDYILESLPRGVLVLTDDATCEVLELPPLGDGNVEVEIAEPTEKLSDGMDTSAPAKEEPPPPAVPSGRNREEKQAILERLQQYRHDHGLGCWRDVAKQAGGGITEETIRAIYAGEESLTIAGWRMIDRALKTLTEKEGSGSVEKSNSNRL